MGLDMYAFKTKQPIDKPFGFEESPSDVTDELAYWRKFNNLHGWMKRLYEEKGGTDEFNCVRLLLTLEDLARLETDAKNKTNLAPTSGFCFGGLTELVSEDQQEILDFVKKAQQAIADGYQVFYTSWW